MATAAVLHPSLAHSRAPNTIRTYVEGNLAYLNDDDPPIDEAEDDEEDEDEDEPGALNRHLKRYPGHHFAGIAHGDPAIRWPRIGGPYGLGPGHFANGGGVVLPPNEQQLAAPPPPPGRSQGGNWKRNLGIVGGVVGGTLLAATTAALTRRLDRHIDRGIDRVGSSLTSGASSLFKRKRDEGVTNKKFETELDKLTRPSVTSRMTSGLSSLFKRRKSLADGPGTVLFDSESYHPPTKEMDTQVNFPPASQLPLRSGKGFSNRIAPYNANAREVGVQASKGKAKISE